MDDQMNDNAGREKQEEKKKKQGKTSITVAQHHPSCATKSIFHTPTLMIGTPISTIHAIVHGS